MKGVKVNFIDVCFLVMEDFLGRGDCCLVFVILCVWEWGVGMDFWWESLDRVFVVWSDVIVELDLSWKYC